MRKSVCFILALCCLLAGCTSSFDDNISSHPASDVTQPLATFPFEYTVTEDGVTITGYTEFEKTAVDIPSRIDGKDVVGLGPNLFYYHRNVKSVMLPESLLYIDGSAFYKAKSLEKINIPKNMRSIDGNVFYCCTSLKEITVHPENAYFCSVDGVLFDRKMTTLLVYPEGKVLEQYNIPEGVQSIQVSAFGHKFPCRKLGIPASVQSIYYDAEEGDCLDADGSKRSITLVVYPDTYAEQFAQKSGYQYEYF